ncbi:SOS response-associated peptidase [Methanoregula sp.]|uniref:SOS response-associated peptidase n=1 Tax=Methanoregula sp. TaxID=2052170 RepID=UPI002CAF1F44|nr:SOS response-associated peptidase [Methanoregula sp.]HVP95893.1 SOS response-associated peptidase [Methanoregula sp.]
MCIRYSLVCIDNLCGRFRVVDPAIGFGPHFSIAPGSTNPVIVAHERAEARMMQWGLVPHWARDIISLHRPANARAENLAEKPMFRELLHTRRCLVPASGFFEWKEQWGKKIPYYFHKPGDPVFAFAGLYDIWQNPAGMTLATYTIITTPANSVVAPVHHRMPAILRQEDEIRWVSREPIPLEEIHRILAPAPPESLAVYAVSERVNDLQVDDERVIAPVQGF